MGDDRLALFAVPAVELDAAAASAQHALVGLHRGLAKDLLPGQVRVVRGGDEVVRQRLGHVLVDRLVRGVQQRIAFRVKDQVGKLADAALGLRRQCFKLVAAPQPVQVDPRLVAVRRSEVAAAAGRLNQRPFSKKKKKKKKTKQNKKTTN